MASESALVTDFFLLVLSAPAWWFLHNWDTTAIGTSVGTSQEEEVVKLYSSYISEVEISSLQVGLSILFRLYWVEFKEVV